MSGRVPRALTRQLWWLREIGPTARQWRFRARRTVRVPRPPTGRPSVILLSVDSLGAAHLGAYGYARATSPQIDRLASEGVLFERVISQSNWTKPSLASIHTGLYPFVHKADSAGEAGDRTTEVDPRRANLLTDRFRTLAQEFQEGGYATAGFTNGGYAHSFFGFGRGFDRYENRAGGLKSCVYHLLEWVHGLPAGSPFFAFIHAWDIHFPYPDRPPYNRLFTTGRARVVLTSEVRAKVNSGTRRLRADEIEFLRGLYDGGVRYVDGLVKLLLDELAALGLAGRTVLALTADHGEAFMEHGKVEHTGCLYQEVLRIPLVLHAPTILTPGHVPAQVRAIDLMPTLLDLCGLTPKGEIQGFSLLPWIDGARRDHLVAVSETERAGGQRAISDGRFKLIRFLQEERSELYDLVEDPGERRSLTGELPAVRGRLEALLDAWERESAALRDRYWQDRPAVEAEEMAEDVIRRLEELGYLG